ncbi:3823_t:CDS:2, partial [Entrophospora sp. SA101]
MAVSSLVIYELDDDAVVYPIPSEAINKNYKKYFDKATCTLDQALMISIHRITTGFWQLAVLTVTKRLQQAEVNMVMLFEAYSCALAKTTKQKEDYLQPEPFVRITLNNKSKNYLENPLGIVLNFLEIYGA